MFVFASFSFTIIDAFLVTFGGHMLLRCSKYESELMSPFLVQVSFIDDSGSTCEASLGAYGQLFVSLVHAFFSLVFHRFLGVGAGNLISQFGGGGGTPLFRPRVSEKPFRLFV